MERCGLLYGCSEAAVMVDYGIDAFCAVLIPIFEEKNSQLAKILTEF